MKYKKWSLKEKLEILSSAEEHEVEILAGYEEFYSKSDDFSATKKGLIDPNR